MGVVAVSKKIVNLPKQDSKEILNPDMIWHLRRPDVYERKMLFLDLALMALANGPELEDSYKVFIREQLKKNGTLAAIKAGNFDTFVFTESRYESYKPVRVGSAQDVLAQIVQGIKTRRELYNDVIRRDDIFDLKFFKSFLREFKKPQEIFLYYQKYVARFLRENNGSAYDKNGCYLGHNEDEFVDFAKCALRNYGGHELGLEILRDLAKYSMPVDANSLFENRIQDLIKYGHVSDYHPEMADFNAQYLSRPEVDFFVNGNRLAKKRNILASKIDNKFNTNLAQIALPKFIKVIESKTADILYGKGNGKNSWCR